MNSGGRITATASEQGAQVTREGGSSEGLRSSPGRSDCGGYAIGMKGVECRRDIVPRCAGSACALAVMRRRRERERRRSWQGSGYGGGNEEKVAKPQEALQFAFAKAVAVVDGVQ